MSKKSWGRAGICLLFLASFILSITVCFTDVFAADADGADEDSDINKRVAASLAQKRDKAPVISVQERIESIRPKPALPEEAVLIRELNVIGSTIIAEKAILKLKKLYTNRKVRGKEMQQIADRITRAYSRHGFITSYAYVVAEKLNDGVLELKVVEGKTGTVTIQGNKYFSTKVLRKKIPLEEGGPFNMIELTRGLSKINRHRDRKASLKLDPSADGTVTDITITVKDNLPLHTILAADNYGSEYILYKRYKVYFIHNNLTGHDDSASIKIQRTEGDAHQLADLDYYIPLSNNWKLLFYIMPYKTEVYYYKDNKDTDFEKHARKSYFNFYQTLIDEPDCELVSSYGFVYKDIHWYSRKEKIVWDNPTARDRFRALMWGIDFNRADRYGRWVIANDLEVGIARMWGGATHEDDMSSIQGAGGDYAKNHLVVARRQKLFHGIDFIAKTHWQMTNKPQPGVNVFSVGGFMGVIDNRGFPRAQAPGDNGRSITVGFTFPPFGVPRNINVPYSKTKLYDSLQFFTFFDWAQPILKAPRPATDINDPVNDKKITTWRSAGTGFAFNVPDRQLSVRIDLGWPLNHVVGKDGDHMHLWWSVSKGF